MIASFTNNFIFLRTRKTGGSSAEIVLSSWCAKPDVCTRLSDAEEPVRKEYGGLRPLRTHNGHRVYHHMPANEVKDAFPDLWNTAFKFAIERHPYEKVVSRVYWNIGRRFGDPVAEFSSEMDATLSSDIFVDRDVYTIGEQVVADEVIRYDVFWSRLEELAVGWGVQLPQRLPMLKAEHRKDRRPASEILTRDQKKKIQKVAAFEFDKLGFAP